MARTPFLFSPRDAREAAEILGAASRLAASGRRARVGLVESPFRPAEPLEFPAARTPWRGIETLGGSGDPLIFLDHSSMAAIDEISKEDLLAVAGGGARLSDVVAAANEAGLFFPHEADFLMREATIAEIIMDGSIVKTEGRFGGLREYLLGLEIVTPAGDVIRTGSRSVKDVTGYDTTGFLMGGGGRCGMICRATLRLLPARGTRFPFACAGDGASIEKLSSLIHTELDAAFLEIFDDGAAQLLGARIEEHQPPAPPAPDGARGGFSESSALLVGELLSSEPGRERELFEKAREIAAPGITLRGLADASLDAYRRFPALVIEASGGSALYHLAHDCRPMTARHFRAYNSMSLFPGRRNSYFPREDLPADFATMVLEAGERARMEIIERRGHGFFRRRIGESEMRVLAGGGSGAEDRPAAGESGEDGEARDVVRELDERVFKVFDPHMIMMP